MRNEVYKEKRKKKTLKLKKKNLSLIIAIIIFVISLIGVSGYFINRYFVPHQPHIDIEEPVVPQNEEPEEPQPDPKLEQIKNLYQENNDLIGWLTIPDTKVDYPVMFTKGDDYYLRRDFYGNYDTAGTLLIDKHQDMQPRDINIIIHGHNMEDGTMFRDLLNYKEQSYYETHKRMVYYTLEERQEYEIIAVFLSKVYRVKDQVFKYYKFYGNQTEESYNDYITNIKRLSLYNIDLSATYPEELITLSTCEYSQEDGRLVVVAKRIS